MDVAYVVDPYTQLRGISDRTYEMICSRIFYLMCNNCIKVEMQYINGVTEAEITPKGKKYLLGE